VVDNQWFATHQDVLKALEKSDDAIEWLDFQNPIHVVSVKKTFDINETAFSEGQRIIVKAHVETLNDGQTNIVFSQLSRPPAFSSSTSVTLRPGERRVLRLPFIKQGSGKHIETLVTISNPEIVDSKSQWVKQVKNPYSSDSNGHSRFEIE
jgi:hypothetical protein